jgi:hypothetical protein
VLSLLCIPASLHLLLRLKAVHLLSIRRYGAHRHGTGRDRFLIPAQQARYISNPDERNDRYQGNDRRHTLL